MTDSTFMLSCVKLLFHEFINTFLYCCFMSLLVIKSLPAVFFLYPQSERKMEMLFVTFKNIIYLLLGCLFTYSLKAPPPISHWPMGFVKPHPHKLRHRLWLKCHTIILLFNLQHILRIMYTLYTVYLLMYYCSVNSQDYRASMHMTWPFIYLLGIYCNICHKM